MLLEGQHKSLMELQSLISTINKSKLQSKMKRTPRFRFRAAARTVINNLKWIKQEPVAEEEKEDVSSKQPKITLWAKFLLRIPPEERTVDQKEELFKIMGQLQCFDRYPEKVRDSLTAAAIFNYFPPGRVLVAEGHPSVAMYFIISGTASVSKLTFDPGTKKYKSEEVTVINAGYAFGEINILHDELWPTTVTTTTHVEILTIRKENFQMILEEFLGEQKKEISKCLSQFSYFKNWNQRTIVECCILARIVSYKKDSLIMDEQSGDTENSYFIVSGSCCVIYHLQLEIVRRNYFTGLKIMHTDTITKEETFPSSFLLRNVERPKRKEIADPFVTGLIVDKLLQEIINELPLSEPESLTEMKATEKEWESHFFEVAELLPGACFGIGEFMDKKHILCSSHEVVLLRIPRYFLKLHNLGNIWGRVRELYNHTYPSPQSIFGQFLIDRSWIKSRTKYVDSLIKAESPFTGLTCAEAPYHTRLTSDFENHIFKRSVKILSEKRQPSVTFKFT